jgi:GT2 family glycosyltransferase
MKTLIGIVTFGNLEFTKLTIDSIRETTKSPVDFFVVIGKPGDKETPAWLQSQDAAYMVHRENRGFPASINDIYDYAWFVKGYSRVIIAGNDIVPYPGAIDALIDQATTTDFEWIASSMFDVQSLVAYYPEQARYFEGPTFTFRDWGSRPWDVHAPTVEDAVKAFEWMRAGVESNPEGPSLIKDVRNLCLFKYGVFEKLGYADVNFWPGGYFEDNDYARRAVNAGIKSCALPHSQYFHFWSRTIHQGEPGGAITASKRDACFCANERFYLTKWGGPFSAERYAVPFDAGPFALTPEIVWQGALKIPDRIQESAIIEHWAGQNS